MLTFEEAEGIVREVKCSIFGQDLQFRFEPFDDAPSRWFLQVRAYRPDTEGGEWGMGGGAKEYVSPHSAPDEIVKKCLKLSLEYVEHEIREGFEFGGFRLFGPHIRLDALMAASKAVSYREPQVVTING